jgi:hypothetical protein
MNDDPVLGGLLRHLGDPDLDSQQVSQLCGELLSACVQDAAIPVGAGDALAFTLLFKNQQRAAGGVVEGSRRESPEVAVASVWAHTMAAVILSSHDDAHLDRAWTLCRQAVGALYSQRAAVAERIAGLAAKITVGAVLRAEALDGTLRDQLIMRVVAGIPEGSRDLWFKAVRELS